MKKNKTTIKANELDRLFDEGGDISSHLDFSRASRPGLEQKRVIAERLKEEKQGISLPRQRAKTSG